MQPTGTASAGLYQTDETAWLETTADLLRSGRLAEVDAGTLAEYLTDMANRDYREVRSRLFILLAHLLKWDGQPDRRSNSWGATIREQRRELQQILTSRTLYNHAVAVLADVYADARTEAAVETGLPVDTFPPDCPWEVDEAVHGPNP